MIQSLVLANGFQAIIAPSNHVPMIHVHIVYPFNPMNVPDGVPHLAEHLLFEETHHLPDGDIDRLLRLAGGNSTAWTTWDALHVETSIPSENVELLLFIEKERSTNLCRALDPINIENQRKIIAQEMWNRSFQKDGELADQLRKRSFETHPILSTEVMGLIYDIENANTESICSFLQTWIHPSNAIWLVSGDVKIEHFKNQLKFNFEEFPDVSPSLVTSSKNLEQSRRMFQFSTEDRLFLVWKTPPRATQEDWWIGQIIQSLTTEGDFIHIDQLYGWKEQGFNVGWMGLEVHTKQPEMAIQELRHWLESPNMNWDVIVERSNTSIQKDWLTNKNRTNRLQDCIYLMNDNNVECQLSRTTPNQIELQSVIFRFLSVDSASVLWQGEEDWLQGEVW